MRLLWCWDSGKNWRRDQRVEVASNCNYRTHHCHKINIGVGQLCSNTELDYKVLASPLLHSSPLFSSPLNLVLPKVSFC